MQTTVIKQNSAYNFAKTTDPKIRQNGFHYVFR